jgi:hypothetical protein
MPRSANPLVTARGNLREPEIPSWRVPEVDATIVFSGCAAAAFSMKILGKNCLH